MDRFIERCAGLDVHKGSVKACVRIPTVAADGTARPARFGPPPPVGAAVGLADQPPDPGGGDGVDGVFWKPVDYLLEDDVECWLLNAQHLKKVPGRKTDVADAAWIAQLVEHGLVRPSFVPPARSGNCAS